MRGTSIRLVAVLVVGAWILAVGQGCRSSAGSSSSVGTAATTTIGPSGGSVTSADGIVTLDVPAGALTADIAFSIVPATGAPPGALGGAYDLGPEGTTFAIPASITIRFTLAELGGAPADQLEIGSVVSGAWQPAPGSVIDVAGATVSAPTTHLSRWAIVPAASNPCTCHPADWNACCTQHGGAYALAGQVCTCTRYQGDFDDFLACYTSRIGGERVTNFCSACLEDCCTKNGGAVNRACDCEFNAPGCGGVAPPSSVLAVMACSRTCFGSPDTATVCVSPSGPGVCGLPPGGGAPDASSADGASGDGEGPGGGSSSGSGSGGGSGSGSGDDASDEAGGEPDAGGDAGADDATAGDSNPLDSSPLDSGEDSTVGDSAAEASSGTDGPSGDASASCLYGGWRGCPQDHVCCNGTVPALFTSGDCATQPGEVVCVSQLGDPCYVANTNYALADKTYAFCGNTNGGTAPVGTIVATVGGDACYVDSCTSDSDCLLGYTCAMSQCYQHNCYEICATFMEGWTKSLPCCSGLTPMANGTCAVPGGYPCGNDTDCASGHCLVTATTAVCQ